MNEEEAESAEEINWKNGKLECCAREIKWLNPLFHHSIQFTCSAGSAISAVKLFILLQSSEVFDRLHSPHHPGQGDGEMTEGKGQPGKVRHLEKVLIHFHKIFGVKTNDPPFPGKPPRVHFPGFGFFLKDHPTLKRGGHREERQSFHGRDRQDALSQAIPGLMDEFFPLIPIPVSQRVLWNGAGHDPVHPLLHFPAGRGAAGEEGQRHSKSGKNRGKELGFADSFAVYQDLRDAAGEGVGQKPLFVSPRCVEADEEGEISPNPFLGSYS